MRAIADRNIQESGQALAGTVDRDVDVYIVLDDITTSGSSLEAAKRLLAAGGAEPGGVVKMAVAKAAHDEGYYA